MSAMIRTLSFASMILFFATGCLFLDSNANHRAEVQKGYTECGDFLSDDTNYCSPGEYCKDSSFSKCTLGCLSNENCADDQRCVKADGDQIGACQNTGKHPASEPRIDPVLHAGETDCGVYNGQRILCQAGQYCMNSKFSTCSLGCLSNKNCDSDQKCVKEDGHNVGICF